MLLGGADKLVEEMPASERQRLEHDSATWTKVAAGTHLSDWLALGGSLVALSAKAMAYNRVNHRHGRGYSTTMGEMLARWFPGIDKPSVTALLWLHEENRLEVLEELRAAMTPAKRAKLNSPITAKQLVARHLGLTRPRASTKADTSERVPTVEALQRRIRELEEQVEEAGALFPLWPVAPDKLPDVARSLYEGAQAPAVRLAQLILKRDETMKAHKAARGARSDA